MNKNVFIGIIVVIVVAAIILIISEIPTFTAGEIISVTGIGTLIAGVAALFTSIIVLLTLFEMREQRKSSYMPDIILGLSPLKIYLYSEKNHDVYLPTLWSTKNVDKYSENYDGLIKDPTRNKIGIPIFNIGMGAAKNVKVDWDFKNSKKNWMIKFINQQKIENPLWPSNYEVVISIPVSHRELGENWTYNIDYIIPSQFQETSQKIFFPNFFQSTYSQFLTFNYSDLDFLKDGIYLDLTIDYEDIGNVKHQKKFRCYLRDSSMEYDTRSESQKFIIKKATVEVEITEI
jgi:hypothetical protein